MAMAYMMKYYRTPWHTSLSMALLGQICLRKKVGGFPHLAAAALPL